MPKPFTKLAWKSGKPSVQSLRIVRGGSTTDGEVLVLSWTRKGWFVVLVGDHWGIFYHQDDLTWLNSSSCDQASQASDCRQEHVECLTADVESLSLGKETRDNRQRKLKRHFLWGNSQVFCHSNISRMRLVNQKMAQNGKKIMVFG